MTITEVSSVFPKRVRKATPPRILIRPQQTTVPKPSENDLCVINIPHEMLIIGSLSPHMDGSFARIVSIEGEEAKVELVKDSQIYFVPLFCLTQKKEIQENPTPKKTLMFDLDMTR
jgi:hypothetical protein